MDENKKAAGRLLTAEELSAFCLQLSYPVSSGISPVECIGLMLEETTSSDEKMILKSVYEDLVAGAPLSDALAKTGRFPPYMMRMISVGQVSGNLDKVLDLLVTYYGREAERSAGIRRAITGPSVMLGVMAVLIIVLITRVLPVFNQVFQQMGTELSPLARGLLRAGDVIQGSMVVLGIAFVLVAAAVFAASRSRSGGAALGRIADTVFFRGKLNNAIARARFASAMAVMTSGGIVLDESLSRCQELLEGSSLEKPVSECRELLRAGENFPAAAQKAGIFTGMMNGILSAGFRSGSFDRAIQELAARCQANSEEMLERFVARIEPSLIIVLSISVGLILLSVMLPLISMLSSIGF